MKVNYLCEIHRMYFARLQNVTSTDAGEQNLPASRWSSPFIHPFIKLASICSRSEVLTIISASFPFCCRNSAILAAVRRCLSATVLQSIQAQSLNRHWCLCPRSSDKIPWFLQRVHFGLRFEAAVLISAGLSLFSSLISCWCISCLFHRRQPRSDKRAEFLNGQD